MRWEDTVSRKMQTDLKERVNWKMHATDQNKWKAESMAGWSQKPLEKKRKSIKF